jgi:hypothetical protein
MTRLHITYGGQTGNCLYILIQYIFKIICEPEDGLA